MMNYSMKRVAKQFIVLSIHSFFISFFLVLPASALNSLAKNKYLGTAVGSTLPGYKVLKAVVVIARTTFPFDGDMKKLPMASWHPLEEVCRITDGIGIVNFTANMSFYRDTVFGITTGTA